MANPGAAAGGGYLAARYHTVFIDTSLDTHMAMVVGEADTVGDFKKKIKEEHALCFPDIGEIRINALQVKCRGFLYHLSDAMFVKNAFDGVKSKWFLYVDASRMVNHGLDICGPFMRANGILRYLECKDLVDVSDELLNEPDKTVQEFPKDNLLNEKDIGNGTNDMFRKVLSDMVIELEQTGGDHCRTSSSDTNKKTPEAYESTFPDSEMKTSRRKRKADDTENHVDKDMPTGDVMDEHVKLSNSERKKRKIQKKEKKSSNGSKTKTNSSALVASGEGAQIDDAIQEKTVPINFTINSTVDMLCDTVLEGHEALNSVLSTDARQESGNEARYDVPKKTRRHLYSLNIGPSNELSNGAEAMHLEPVTEAVSPDHSHKSVSEDSLMRKVPKVRKHPGGSDIAAARSSDVPLEKNEHSS